MGLLKGSKIRYTEGSAIIGDEIIAAADPMPVVEIGGAGVVQRTIPQAEEYHDPNLEDWELGGEQGLDDLFQQETHVEEAQEAGPDWEAPMREFEEAREQMLYSANDAADLDMNDFGEQVMGATEQLMTATIDEARQTLAEANQAGDFERVMPYVQKRVAVELDLELVGTANEIRWTHLKRIEEKIVEDAADMAAEIKYKHPEDTIEGLLARREEILSEARLEAERLMMEAMTRSAETQAQAERARAQTLLELEGEREHILEELREQAYREGYDEGKTAGERDAAHYVQEALNLCNRLQVALPEATKRNEEKLVTLALEIASKVIQEEIALQPEVVQRIVETALRRVSDLEQVTVKVNPLDLDLILPKQETFKMLMPDVQNFAIEGSHTIARGGCLIETNSGSINATLEAQLGIVEELFRNVRAEYEETEIAEMHEE